VRSIRRFFKRPSAWATTEADEERLQLEIESIWRCRPRTI
jgi:hypothetical protein